MMKLLRQSLAVAIAGIGLALGLTFPANSLTADEAGTVSTLLAELSSELGDIAYDEEEADRIFDEDEASEGRIAAAGFSRESWREALDATFRGYLATIPADEFAELLALPMARLEQAVGFSEEQKAEVRAWAAEKLAELEAMRAEGKDHADVVMPHAAELDALFDAKQ